MITEEERSNLDSLSSLFLNAFEAAVHDAPYTPMFTDHLEISIPAKDPRVGDIHIWLDADEVTVGIGRLFHTHFETYLDDTLTAQEARVHAIENAVEFIKDILADRVVIEITYEGKRPVQAGAHHVDSSEARSLLPIQSKRNILKRLFPPKITVERLLWSGAPAESR